MTIDKFFECLLPTTQCNIACEYCYIIQENRRDMKQIELDYSVKHIIEALSVKRLGGVCYFSICGTGETFLQRECVDIIKGLLSEGHYVNVTTNGTITRRIIELLDFDKEMLKKLHFSFSFHYIELKKLKQLDVFFENIKRVKRAGCSFVVQFNLYDGYIPYLEEIKRLCLENIGQLPQVAATRLELNGDVKSNIKFHTQLSDDEYIEIGKKFESPLFDFTVENFNKRRNEFCYAGEWAFNLNLKTGDLKACYHSGKIQNIFKNIEKPIIYEAVGKNCNSVYCINSSHFLSLGCIPSLKTPSYADLRDRKDAGWYNDELRSVLSKQFAEYKSEYSIIKKVSVNTIGRLRKMKRNLLG